MKRYLFTTITAGIFVTIVACSGVTSPSPSARSVPTPSVSLTPAPDVAANLFWLQKTQVAVQTSQAVVQDQIQFAQLNVTSTAAQATLNAQSTQDAVHLTQVAFDRQLTADAATAAAAWTATQFKQNLEAAQTATAVAGIGATQVKSATETQQWYADQDRTRTDNLKAQQARLDEQTIAIKTWGIVVAAIVLAVILLFMLWRWWQLHEDKSRIIEQPGGKHLIIANQKRNLTEYLASNTEHLPALLRFLAWLIETNTVLVDPERNVNPVTVIQNGSASSPPQAAADVQERTTARSQQVQLAHELAPRSAAVLNAVSAAMATSSVPLLTGGALPPPDDEGHLAEDDYQIVTIEQAKPLLEEARTYLSRQTEEN